MLPFVQAFDTADAKIGAERNQQKTEVICHVADLDAAPLEWKLASVSTAVHGNITLGVAVGNACSCVQDAQTEFALLRESLGVSRINHILRVHGHTILHDGQAAAIFDEVGQRSLERLFPGFTEDSSTQAALSASQSGLGCKRSVDVARPTHLGALMAAKPPILDIIRSTATADFVPEQTLPEPSSLKLQSMHLLAHGRRQDSVYIGAVLSRTSMVDPSAMLDVGLCSVAIPDIAVPCGLLC